MRILTRDGRVKSKITCEERLIRKLYSTKPGHVSLKVLTDRRFSVLVGKFMDTRLSAVLIDSFIKKNHIDISEYLPARYKTFNKFFTRKVRPELRPYTKAQNEFISPCDSKLSVYQITENSVLFIKNTCYTVESLFHNSELADEFCGGWCLVFRLGVDDYHRYCYIDNGRKSVNRHISGKLHTVNPIATEYEEVYRENEREYCTLYTDNFGKVIQMEVGAMCVGRIVNLHEDAIVRRGQEKGYFEFGGSTIVLLVKRDSLSVDADIIKNTERGYETRVRYGETIGRTWS